MAAGRKGPSGDAEVAPDERRRQRDRATGGGGRRKAIVRSAAGERSELGDRSSRLTPVSSWIRMIAMSPSTLSIVVDVSSPASISRSRATGTMCLWCGDRLRAVAHWGDRGVLSWPAITRVFVACRGFDRVMCA
jgi:hypothetical protein